MKVTIIADVLGDENNGTTTACMNLVRYLRSCGDEVTIVCCDNDKKDTKGYYVVGTHNLGPIINYIVKKNNVVLAKADNRIITEAIKDADIVHIMMPFSLGKATAKLARKMGKPTTAGFHVQAENFTSHLGLMNGWLVNRLTYHVFYQKLYRQVDGVHYPTDFIRNTFEKQVHHKTNGYVISNGVNDIFTKRSAIKPDILKDKFVILFTGRFSKEKSHLILVRAVAKSKYKDKIQLVFAGQGPRDAEIKRCSRKLGLQMPIMKFFKRDELVNIINYADLYCHPAEVEIEAIACLEAICCGVVPVIANSKKCATKSFAIDEKNLFRCNSSRDLAAKIDYWIEHPEEKVARSEQYREFAVRFKQDECMENMRKMMTEIISHKYA